jgi:hypothetical protein
VKVCSRVSRARYRLGAGVACDLENHRAVGLDRSGYRQCQVSRFAGVPRTVALNRRGQPERAWHVLPAQADLEVAFEAQPTITPLVSRPVGVELALTRGLK